MATAKGPSFRSEIELDTNEAQARREMDHLGDVLSKALIAALAPLSGVIEKSIGGALKKALNPSTIAGFTEGLDHATLSSRRLETEIEQLRGDSAALEKQVAATRKTLQASGADSNLFAGVERQIEQILALQRTLDQQADRLSVDPGAVRALQLQYDTIRTTISRDVAGIQSVLKSFTTNQRQELIRQTSDASHASRERVALVNAEKSKFVVAAQQEGALVLAEKRRQDALQLQAAKAHSRSRIELIRFTLRQITALEKSIGSVFRGTASALGSAFSKIEGTVFRTSRVIRAENSAMTQGLQPALLSRERFISRSFHSQESTIRSSVIRQERALQQLNAQASRGVAGAVTGRSAVGGLLGGGLAFGGVFAVISKLKQGFQESVNLNESLNKTQQIFGTATQSILDFADTSVEALFVTKSAALEAAANFGIFGRSAGLAGPDLANFSKRLTVLATDLASFNNTSIADATTAISAALRGESEPIRKYGVLLDAATLEQRAFADGITDTLRKLTPMERVLAANNEILAQTVVMQGDAARTADDFANSSRRAAAASIEFFASIAKFAVPLATVLTNGILPVFVQLTKFVNNEVGPGLKILRDGLIGAGAALGSLLAARATVQLLKILAIAAKFAAGPMGLLAIAVAGLGAAVNIFAKRSPEFRKVLSDIRESVGERLRQGLELARDVFEKLSDLFVNTLIPAAIALAGVVRDKLLSAFNATVGFVRDIVIPAFVRFGNFLRDVVFPAIVNIADSVRDRLTPAFNAVLDFLQPVIDGFLELGPAIRSALTGDFTTIVTLLEPILDFIKPITDAFKDLGSVVADVFSGDFGGALDRIRDFGVKGAVIAAAASAGIALAFVNPFLGLGILVATALGTAFGDDLLEVVRPQIEKVQKFIKGVFSSRSLEDIALGFLNVVRRIGEIIGGIVTDRRFVTALAAIAAAAAATAGAFIVGFAQGVQSNIPELARLIGGALKKAFIEAFKFAVGNPADFAQILAGIFLATRLISLFRRSGDEAAKGFVKGFGSSIKTNAISSFRFAGGALFGAQGLERLAAESGERAAAKFKKSLTAGLQSANRDLQRLGQGVVTPGAPGRFAIISPEDLEEAQRRINDVKERLGAAATEGALFRARVGEAFGGAGLAAQGFADILGRDVQGGFTKIKVGAKTVGIAVKDIFTSARTSFKESGRSAGEAIGGAILSGVGAALSGQQLGQATSAGGAALGIAGIISSALFAGASVGPGPQQFIVGGLVASLGAVVALISASGREAAKAKDEINEYADALREANTASQAFAGLAEVVQRNLREESDEVVDILSKTGFTFEGFARSVSEGSVNARQLAIDFFRSIGPDGAAAVKVLQDNLDIKTFDDLEAVLVNTSRGGGTLQKALVAAGFDVDDFKDALEFLRDEANELSLALPRVKVEKTFEDVPTVTRNLDDVLSRVKGVRGALEELRNTPGGGIAQFVAGAEIDRAQRELADTATAIDAVQDAVATLNQARTDRINEQISEVTDKLGNAKEAAQLARDAIASFFGGQDDTARDALNDTINSILSTGQAVGDALAKPTNLQAAALETALGSFNDQVGVIASRAFAETPTLNTAGLLEKLQPLFNSIREAAGLDETDLFTPEVGQRLIDEITGKLDNGDFQAVVDLASKAQESADTLQKQWNDLNVALETDIAFSPVQIINALADALGVSFSEAERLFSLTIRTGPFTSGFDEAGVFLGAATGDGIVSGVKSKLPDAADAVSQVAKAMKGRFKSDMAISSPSKVFRAFGVEIPAGIAQGVLDGAPDATAALRALSETLFERLLFLPGSLAENFASVLEEIPGALDAITPAIEPVTESINGFAESTFEAIKALELLAGADLSKIGVGAPEGANPNSNAGRVANQFAGDLAFRLNNSAAHPPGWVQTEDGSWVPPSFFAPTPLPPNPATPTLGVNVGEGTVSVTDIVAAAATAAVTAVRQTDDVAKVNIERMEFNENASARATAREAVMALAAASLGA